MKYFLVFLFALSLNAAPNIDPDVEIRVNGLVCSSCAIGLKNIFKKDSRVKGLKWIRIKVLFLLSTGE